jgi:hypothetical protein
MKTIRDILRRTTSNMDAAAEAFVRETAPGEPLHLAFVPTPEEQATAKARKAGRVDRSGRVVVPSFDPDESPVERARNEVRSKRADAARASRRRKTGNGNLPRRPGPLEADYDPSAVSPRLKASGRIAQLIVKMKPLYAVGDRSGFDKLVHEFDWLSDLLEGEPGWGIACRMQLFPDFVSDEDMDRA